jgi:selenide,water dikinase
VLVLSKPIDTGIVLAGGGEADKEAAIARMRVLNLAAAEALATCDPHAVTDVTGFGLLGHGWEMAERGEVTLRFVADRLPLYAGSLQAAEAGVRTGGDPRNRAHLEAHVTVDDAVPAAIEALAYDPQTSGGLLAAVDPADAERLVGAGFTVIGDVLEGPAAVHLAGTLAR